MIFFIKYKNGSAENYEIERFTMVGSTIRIETDGDILYLDYSPNEVIHQNQNYKYLNILLNHIMVLYQI